MKKVLQSIIITSLVVFGAMAPTASAQSIEEQYEILTQQLITLLEQRVADLMAGQTLPPLVMGTTVGINPDETCAMRYAGEESIMSIQQELKDQGYTITKVDGKVGPETRAAVTAFQTAEGAVKIDGIIGQETRSLLAENAVVCKGDPSAVMLEVASTDNPAENQCGLSYRGKNDIMAVQQELQNQGYDVVKVDGIIGEETRAAVRAFQTDAAITIDGLIGEELRTALSRNSVSCQSSVTPEPSEPTSSEPTEIPTPTPTPTPTPPEQTPTEGGTTTGGDASVIKNDITASVRTTTAGFPDDTAVFTYMISFVLEDTIYIPTNPNQAFEIDVMSSGGSQVSAEGISSLISSSQKILREDGTSWFLVENGDTMSLRTTVQPGEGSYYAELGRLSYTTENAFTVVNPAMINYGFDDDEFRSEAVTLLN